MGPLKKLSQTDFVIDDRFVIGGAQHARTERAGSTGAVSDWSREQIARGCSPAASVLAALAVHASARGPSPSVQITITPEPAAQAGQPVQILDLLVAKTRRNSASIAFNSIRP